MTRIGFAGTSAWAAEALARLSQAPGIEVACVLTQPDRPAGRGRRLRRPAAAEAGETLGVPVLQPERPADALADLHAAGVEAMALVAYGGLVPQALLEPWTWLNLHPSPLPRWRGAAPIERALLAGDSETAACVMVLVRALDAGPVAACERFAIDARATAGDLYATALDLGLPPLTRALAAAARGDLATVPQLGEPTYAAKIGADDRLLRPLEEDAAACDRRIRALSPHVGARLGDGLVVWAAHPAEDEVAPGELARSDGRFLLGCAGGALELDEVQAPGRSRMDAAAYVRGLR